MRRGRWTHASLVFASILSALVLAAPSMAADGGALTLKGDADACFQENGDGVNCNDADGLARASSVVTSPDGRYVYATGLGNTSQSFAVFARTVLGPDRGKLSEVTCFNESAGDNCQSARELYDPYSVQVSPDGNYVYVGSYANFTAGIAVFGWSVDGNGDPVLTQLAGPAGCIGWYYNDGCTPTTVGLYNLEDISMAPDGKTLYAAVQGYSMVAAFARDAATGALTPPTVPNGCVSEGGAYGCQNGRELGGTYGLAVSPDSQNVYVAAGSSSGVATLTAGAGATLTQAAGEDGCADQQAESRCMGARGLYGARGITVTPDGSQVLVASRDSDALSIFDRRADGALRQPRSIQACFSSTGQDYAPGGTPGQCRRASGIEDPTGIAVSADGQNVYVNGTFDNAIAEFSRDGEGRLHRLAGIDNCISDTGDLPSQYTGNGAGYCTGTGNGAVLMDGQYGRTLTISPDGRNVYLAAGDTPSGGTLSIFDRTQPDSPAAPAHPVWDFAEDFKLGARRGEDDYGRAGVWSYKQGAGGDGSTRNPSAYVATTDSPAEGVTTGTDNGNYPRIGDRGIQQGYVHPGDNTSGVIEWTNPGPATTVEVDLEVSDADPCCWDGVRWYLDKGTDSATSPTNIAGGDLLNGAAAQTYDDTVSVAAGESIYVVVAAKGSPYNDGTYVDLRITGALDSEPQTTITSGPRGTIKSRTPQFGFASDQAGATFKCNTHLQGSPAGAFSACTSGAATSSLADGDWVFEVKANNGTTDDPTPAKRHFTVDATPPTVVITAGPSGTTRDDSPRFNWTQNDEGHVSCRLDTAPYQRCDDNTIAYRGLAEGAHSFSVIGTDLAGNDSPPVTRNFTLDTSPDGQQPGVLSQLSGTAGCLFTTYAGGPPQGQDCAAGDNLSGALDTVVSPDGKQVYATAFNDNALTIFDRNTTTGALTERDTCFSAFGGNCTGTVGLYGTTALALSRDGTTLYVAGYYAGAIAVFRRDPATGDLTQAGVATPCITAAGGGCGQARGLQNPVDIAVSANDAQVYVADEGSDSVLVLDRAADGSLTQKAGLDGCYSDSGSLGLCRNGRGMGNVVGVATTPDGNNVYATISGYPGGVVSFSRASDGSLRQMGGEDGCLTETGAENCFDGRDVYNAGSIAVAPDGNQVYAGVDDGIAVLDRDSRGALSQSPGRDGCILRPNVDNSCSNMRPGDNQGGSLVVSPDGQNVYAVDLYSDAIMSLRRDDNGDLTQLTGRDACYRDAAASDSGSCRSGRALFSSYGTAALSMSPDGSSLYLAGRDYGTLAAFRRNVPVTRAESPRMEWDALADFDQSATPSNPTADRYGNAGVWRYMKVAANNDGTDRFSSTYTALPNYDANPRNNRRAGWYDSEGSGWLGDGVADNVDRFFMHPEQDGDGHESAVTRWRDPLPGTRTFRIQTLVEDTVIGGDGVIWYLDRNATNLDAGTLAPGAKAQESDRTVTLSQGDTIDLVLSPRADYNYDSTLVDIHITAADAEPGPQTVITSGPGRLTSDNTPRVTLASATGTGFECQIDGAGWSSCPASQDLAPLADGAHVLRARATTATAADPTPATRRFTVDTTKPVVSILSGPAGTTRAATPTFTFSSTEPGVIECRLDSSSAADWTDCSSPYTLPELTDGQHTLELRAYDRARNLSDVKSRTFTVSTGAGGLQPGALAQLSGSKGCIAQNAAAEGCTGAAPLNGPTSSAISADGQFVYTTSYDGSGIVVSKRATGVGPGALTPLTGSGACLNANGDNGCDQAYDLSGAWGVAVVGNDVYVTGRNSNAVASFKRDPGTGALTQVGCLRENDSDGGRCTVVRGMYAPQYVVPSPDGKQLYVSGEGNGGNVAVLDRDPATGALSQRAGSAACFTQDGRDGCTPARHLSTAEGIAITPDGNSVYVASLNDWSVLEFRRAADGSLTQSPNLRGCLQNDGSGNCADGRDIAYPRGLAVSPDGRNLYITSEYYYLSGLSVADILADGSLQQIPGRGGCVRDDGGDGCTDGTAMATVNSVIVSGDGQNVYASTRDSNSVAAFERRSDGTLRQLSGIDDCWSQDGSGGFCRDGKAMDAFTGQNLVESPDGAHVYLTAYDSDAVAAFARRQPAPASGPQDQEWDASEDYVADAAGANPAPDRYGRSNVWTYRNDAVAAGNGDGRDPANYVALPTYRSDAPFGGTYPTRVWVAPPDSFPFIGRTDYDRFAVHPANDSNAVFGWRNPTGQAIDVDVSGLVADIDTGASGGFDGVQWYVDQGATHTPEMPSGTLHSGGRQSFDFSTNVPAGGYLWFYTARGANRDSDGTFFDVTITGPREAGPQTTIASSPRVLTNDNTPRFTLTSDTGTGFECQIDGGGWNACPASQDLPSLADGVHTFKARATTASATDASPAVRTFTVDTAVSAVAIDNGPDGLTKDRTPTYEFTALTPEDGLTYECRVDSASGGSYQDCTSPFTPAELAAGDHTLDIRARDRADNAGTPAHVEFTVDTAAGTLQFGGLTQLAGTAGCVSNLGTQGCAGGTALNRANALAQTPDGRFVYSINRDANSVVVLSRDQATGALSQVQCVSSNGLAGCDSARALSNPQDATVDSTGDHLYVASRSYPYGIVTFSIDRATGQLTQLAGSAGCIVRYDLGQGCAITPGNLPLAAYSLALSADGKSLYTADYDENTVGVLGRDPATGVLSYVSCVGQANYIGCPAVNGNLSGPTGVTVVGNDVYVTSANAGMITAFDRDPSTGAITQKAGVNGCVRWVNYGGSGCSGARRLGNPYAIVASADGKSVYVADQNEDAISVFSRNTTTGALTQSTTADGCWDQDGSGEDGNCQNATGLYRVSGLALAPDQQTLYAVSDWDNTIAIFRRDRANGRLQQLSGVDGCWSNDGSDGQCRDGKALDLEGMHGVLVSPDSNNVYTASPGSDAVDAFARRAPRADNLPLLNEWDAAEDFDTSGAATNPSADRYGNTAVWTYLRGNGNPDGTGTDPAGYLPLLDRYSDGSWRQRWWHSGADTSDLPTVALTRRRQVIMHPGAPGPAVMRWEYPGDQDTTVDLSVRVRYVGCGDGVRFLLQKNGTTIRSGRLLNASGSRGAQIDREVAVTRRDRLELVITSRTGDDNCDSTRVDWHVTSGPIVDTQFSAASQAAGLTNNRSPQFEATSEPGATFECRITPGTVGSGPFQACNTQPFTVGPLADGTYTIESRATVAGRTDPTPAKRVITVDATAPAPAVTTPAAGSATNLAAPALAGTLGTQTPTASAGADTNLVTINVFRGATTSGAPVRTWSLNGSSGTWGGNLQGGDLAVQGLYTVQVVQEDAAGNVGRSTPVSFRYDATAPAIASLSKPDPETNQGFPVVTGVAGREPGTADPSRDGDVVTIDIYAGTFNDVAHRKSEFTATRAEDGSFSAPMPTADGPLPDGQYNVRVTQTDAAGNQTVSPGVNGRQFKVDTVAPTVTLTSPPATTSNRTPPVSGTAGIATASTTRSADSTTVTLKIYANTAGTGTPLQTRTGTRDNAGGFAITPDTSLPDGTYSAVVEQVDGAGNVGRSSPQVFKVDRTGPVISVTTPALRNGRPDTNSPTPLISGTAGRKTGAEADAVADNGTVDVDVYSGTATSGTAVAQLRSITRDALGAYAATVSPALADGTYTAVVRQDDALGNHTDQASTFKIDTVKPAAPAITAPVEGFETKQSRPDFSGQAALEDFTDPAISEDLPAITVRIYDGPTASGTPSHTATGSRDANTSNWTAALPTGDSLPDGRYTAVASQSDNAGNVSASAERHFKVDNTPPRPTIVTDGTPPRTDWDETLVALRGVAGTNDASATQSQDLVPITVKVSSGATVVQTRTVDRDLVTGAYSVTLGALPEGTYTASAEQSDGAGNTGASVAPATFKVDKTDPTPSVTVPSEKQAFAIQNPVFSGGKGDNSGTAATQSKDEDVVRLAITGADTRTWDTTTQDGSSWTSQVPGAPLPEGYYTLTATQKDLAQNSVTTADRHFKIDLTAPSVTIADPGEDIRTPPTLSGTAGTNPGTNTDSQSADDGTVTVKLFTLSGASTRTLKSTLTPTVAGGGGWSVASGLASNGTDDGRYEVEVTQKDAVGNTRTSTPQSFRLDTLAPQITLTSPSGDTNDPTPHVKGTAGTNTGGATDDTSADDNRITVTVTRPLTSTTVIDRSALTIDNTGSFDLPMPSSLPEGTYEVTVAQVDGAGNNSASAPQTFRVDLTKPSGLTASQPSGDIKQVRPTFSGAAGNLSAGESQSPDGDVSVEVLSGAAVVRGPFTIARTGAAFSGALQGADLPEGDYTWRATQKDAAGNSVTTAERPFRVDTTAPAPTIDEIAGYTSERTPIVSGTPGNAFHDQPLLTVTLTGPGATQVLQADGNSTGYGVIPSPLADGTWTATVAQSDQAGNTSAVTRTFKVDATAPVVTTAAIAPSQNAPSISGTAGAATADASHSADSETVHLVVDPVTTGLADPADVDATRGTAFPTLWTATYPATLPEGRYRVTASQADGATPANVGTAQPQDFVVDRTAPAPQITAPAAASRKDRTFNVRATLGSVDDADHAADATKADIRIYEGAGTGGPLAVSYADVPADASRKIDKAVVMPAGPDGQYTIVVDQADAAGNHGTDSRTIKVDATAPAVSVTAPAQDQHVQPARPTFSGTKGTTADGAATSADLDAIRVKVYDNAGLTGTPKVFTTDSGTGTWSVQADQNLAEGFYWAVAEQDDAAGNTGASSVRRFRVDLTDPQPAIVSPADNAYTNDTTPDVTIARGTDTGDLAPVTVTFTRGTTTVTKTAGTGVTTVTADPLAEGDWTITASQSDQSGRTGTTAPRILHVDTTNPVPAVGSITSPAKNVTAVSGTAGTAAGDANSVRVKVSGTTIDQDVAVSGGSWTVNLPQPVSEGAHTVDVSQSDAAGNQGTASRSFTIDRTAPAPAATSPSGDITNRQPTLEGTAGTAANDDLTVIVHLTRVSDNTTTDFAGVPVTGGNWQKAITSNLADDRYDLTVTQSDVAGNSATSAPRRFRVDSAAPTVALDPLGTPTNDNTPTFTGTAGAADGTGIPSEDGPVHVVLFSGTTVTGPVLQDLTATRNGVNGFSATAATLADGTYTAQVTQSDAAGNAATPATQTFRVDTVAPAVAITSPADGAFTNDNTPDVTITRGTATGDDPDVTVTFTKGTTTIVKHATGSATTVTADQLGDGDWTITAAQSDSAGNTRTTAGRILHVDTVAPNLALTAPADGSYSKTGRPTVSGTTDDGAQVRVSLINGTTTVPLTTTPSGGNWTASVTQADTLADGDWTIRVTQTDAAGNQATAPDRTLRVDSVAPLVTLDAVDSRTADNTPDFAGDRGTAAGDDATVTLTLSGPGNDARTVSAVNDGGRWSFTPATPLGDGAWTITATQVDAAGNSTTTAPRAFTVDTAAPGVAVVSPADNAWTNDNTPEVTISRGSAAGDVADVTVKFTNGTTTLTRHATGTATTVTPDTLADGDWTITAAQSDDLGNTRTTAARTLHVDTAKPTVTVDTLPARTRNTTPTISGTRSRGAGDSDLTVTVKKGAAVVDAKTIPAGSSDTWSLDAATLTDGDYTVSASEVDLAGNVSETATRDFTVDSSGPDVAITSPADGAFTKDTTPDVTITRGTAAGDLGDVTVTFAKGAQTITKHATGSQTTVTADTLAEGDWTITASQSDDVGNTATTAPRTLRVDTTAPTPAVTAPADGATLSDQTPAISGTAGNAAGDDTAVRVTISRSGAADVTLDATVFGANWTVDAPTLAAGAYTVTATQGDAAGNAATSTARSFRIKPTAPSVAITAPAAGSQTTDTTPAISGSAGNDGDDAATVTVKVFPGAAASGAPVQTLTATRSGTAWTVEVNTPLALGAYTVTAEQSDAAGHTGISPATTFSVVAPPPGDLVVSAVTVPAAKTFATTGTFSAVAKVSAPSTVKGELFLAAKLAKKAKIKGRTVTVNGRKVVLLGTARPVNAADTATLKIKVARKTLKALRRLKKAKLLLRITATSGAGQVATSSRTVTYDLKTGIKT